MKGNHSYFKSLMLIISFFLGTFSLIAQNNNSGLELLDEESLFIGGLSSKVLTMGELEVNFYSSLFSNQITLHQSAAAESPVRDRFRLTEFTTNVDVYFGASRSGRWDIGARLKYARRRLDNAARNSPFEVFNAGDETGKFGRDQTFSGMKEIGFRLRVIPFEEVPNLTLTGGYAFSPINSEENKVEKGLGADRSILDFNLSYLLKLNNNSYYYFIVSQTAAPHKSISVSQKWLYNSNFSFFLVQLVANGKIAVYPGISYDIGYKSPDRIGKTLIKTSSQILGFLGVQFQPASNFSLNISTALPLLLETTNKLVQPVRESYSFVSIGGRITF